MVHQDLHLTEKQVLLPGIVLSMNLLTMDLISLSAYIKEKALDNPLIELDERMIEVSFDPEAYSRIAASQASIQQYVCECIGESSVSREVALVAEYLASCLDPDGYLDLEGVPSLPYMDEAIALIQSFSPAGIGARSLSECLIIQLNQQGRLTPELEFLCRNCLEDISKYRTNEIARRIGKGREETIDLIDVIRHLDPKPAAHLNNHQTVNIIPEIKVIEVGDCLIAALNDSAMPVINMAKFEFDRSVRDSTVSSYIREKTREVQSLIRAVDFRRATLLAIAQKIVDIQEEALRHGKGSMKPLRMRDIALLLNVSPSTVSRACAGKYMEYKGRVFPLSDFFSSVLPGRYGDVSSVMIRNVIAEIIGFEDHSHPLSDERICNELELSGFVVSRRTVAKYRSMMNIPSSNERHRRYMEA